MKGRVAIVTGAAQGIGQVYAETLSREGASVVLADLNVDGALANAEAIRAGGGDALGVEVDIADPASVAAMVAAAIEGFGAIDVLVNNAAIYANYTRYSFMDLPLDYWQRFLDVNLTSVLICAQAVAPHMIERGYGRIINQSSAAAQLSRNQYGITKLGVQGLTVGLARELGPHGITVNCIAPGVIDTEATKGLYDEQALEQMRTEMTVVGRLGTPEDLASALVYLASEESSFMTGQIIHVDGGFIMPPG
jgi:3-oxoacyl-[acyl-carrier protein] reductase